MPAFSASYDDVEDEAEFPQGGVQYHDEWAEQQDDDWGPVVPEHQPPAKKISASIPVTTPKPLPTTIRAAGVAPSPASLAGPRLSSPLSHPIFASSKAAASPMNAQPQAHIARPMPVAIPTTEVPPAAAPQFAPASPAQSQPRFIALRAPTLATQDVVQRVFERRPARPAAPFSFNDTDPSAQERREDREAEAAFLRHHDMAPPPAKRQKLLPLPSAQELPPVPAGTFESNEDLPPDFSIVVRAPPRPEPHEPAMIPDSPARSDDALPASTSASDATGSSLKPLIPGPAGVLPPLAGFLGEDLDRTFDNFMQQAGQDADDEGRNSASKAFRSAAARQLENSHDFGRGAWVEMLSHEKWHPYSDPDLPPKKMECSIAWILERGYKAKIKFLFVLIKRLQIIDDDAYAVLRDPTGEINATIHFRVMDLYRELSDGAVMWLEDLSVLSESPKNHHLIITTRNIRFLWPVFTTTKAKLPHKFVHTSIYMEDALPKDSDGIAPPPGLSPSRHRRDLSLDDSDQEDEIHHFDEFQLNGESDALPEHLEFQVLDRETSALLLPAPVAVLAPEDEGHLNLEDGKKGISPSRGKGRSHVAETPSANPTRPHQPHGRGSTSPQPPHPIPPPPQVPAPSAPRKHSPQNLAPWQRPSLPSPAARSDGAERHGGDTPASRHHVAANLDGQLDHSVASLPGRQAVFRPPQTPANQIRPTAQISSHAAPPKVSVAPKVAPQTGPPKVGQSQPSRPVANSQPTAVLNGGNLSHATSNLNGISNFSRRGTPNRPNSSPHQR